MYMCVCVCVCVYVCVAAAAAASLQLCPTLCDPIDGSPPGSPVPGILQARTLEWVYMCVYIMNTGNKLMSNCSIKLSNITLSLSMATPP